MPQPRYRSRSLRRVQKTTPGGKTKTYYSKRKPAVPKCAYCGAELKGIKRMNTAEAKNAAKSDKRVSRAFGGKLCSACLRIKIREEARAA